MATDPESGKQASKAVTAAWVHQDKLVDLQLRADSDKDGKPDRITTTEDHPFWNATDRQWQEAQAVDTGEALLTAEGRLAPVANIVWTTTHQGAAYNLTIADLHTYHVVAGGEAVVVHNTGCGAEWWTSEGNLDEHFRRHGDEMGFETLAEYRYAAEDLMCECDGRRAHVIVKRNRGTSYYLDERSGEFGVKSDAGIVTYFTPDDPRRYFDEQPGVFDDR